MGHTDGERRNSRETAVAAVDLKAESIKEMMEGTIQVGGVRDGFEETMPTIVRNFFN